MINYVNSHHFKPNKDFKTFFMHLVSWRIFFFPFTHIRIKSKN